MRNIWQAFRSLSSPLRTLAIILLSSTLVTGLYAWGPGGSAQPAWMPSGQVPAVIDQAARGIVNQTGLPAPPKVDPGLMQKAQSTAHDALDIAGKGVGHAGTAVDAGGKVVKFGADLVDQVLPDNPPKLPAGSGSAALKGSANQP